MPPDAPSRHCPTSARRTNGWCAGCSRRSTTTRRPVEAASDGGGGGGDSHGSKAAHSSSSPLYSSDDALDQILQYMGRSCKQKHKLSSPQGQLQGVCASASTRPAPWYLRPIETVLGGHMFMKPPPLESPSVACTTSLMMPRAAGSSSSCADLGDVGAGGITDWAMMDRLVASHLNG